MKITKTSPLTGEENTMDLPVTEQQMELWFKRNNLIQNIFPQLTAEQREFLLTGYTPDDWAAMFPPEEE